MLGYCGTFFNNGKMLFPFLGLHTLGPIVFIALLVLIIYFIVNKVQKKNNKELDALEILKTRYAKGEINKEEFNAKKKDLL
jgi:putative membrane protein